MAAKESLTYSRVLVTAYETIRRNLDLKTVGTKLVEGKKLPKGVMKRIKYAMKTDDKDIFHALLVNMDMKSFVIFLEVLDDIQDENHKEILRLLSQQLQQLPLQGVSQEVVDKLLSIKAKYLPVSSEVSSTATKEDSTITTTLGHSESVEEAAACEINPPVLHWEHPVETSSFSRAQENIFYSSVHDITVIMEPDAFPEKLDTLSLSLTVNDYSQPVRFPDGYHGTYSVLLSLKCDPHVEAFRLPVTVTVPHSAVGSLEKLCVLAGAEEEDMLEEDPTIHTEPVDERHLTFKTLHFTRYMLASHDVPVKVTKAKQRTRIKQLKTLSLDETHPASPPLPIPRSHSCPASEVSHIGKRFVAALFTPHDTSGAHWMFTVMVTDHLPTYYNLSEHASQILRVESSANLHCDKNFFTFSSDHVELFPSEYSSNGWTIRCRVDPPVFMRDCVEQYWQSPPAQRADIVSLPYIIYDVYKSSGVSNTSFSVQLKGSRSLQQNVRPIAFQVPCICDSKQPPDPNQSFPTSQKRYSIKIIRDMYDSDSDSELCQVVEFLSGGNYSRSHLKMCDRNCCTLLCEISFHLFKWEEIGFHLGLEELDIEMIKEEYKQEKFYVSAFELLSHWLRSANPTPNLQMLVDALNSCGFVLKLSDWATSYHTIIPRDLDDKAKIKLAKRISSASHWRFAARFLGMPEVDIDDISTLPSRAPHDQAYQMLLEWKKHCPLRPEEAYLQLFKSIHCLNEHIRKDHLKDAARSLE